MSSGTPISAWLGIALSSAMAACGSSGTSGEHPSGGDAALETGASGVDAMEASSDSATGAEDAPSTGDAAQGDGATDGGRDFSTDRTTFFGASRCATAGVQLCEDFESGSVDASTWTVSGTAPVVDGLQHARGSHALHITQNGNGLSYIRETRTFPEPNDTYFGRAFFYFKSLPTPPGMTYAHWTILAASGTGVPGEIRVSGQLQNGNNLFGVGTDNRTDGGTGDWTSSDKDPAGSPSPVPLGQWICIEWMHDGDTNETALWWDAVSHPSLSTTSSVHGGNAVPFLLPEFTSLWIGWQEYQTSTEPFELWVDEIAIDRARIGCVL